MSAALSTRYIIHTILHLYATSTGNYMKPVCFCFWLDTSMSFSLLAIGPFTVLAFTVNITIIIAPVSKFLLLVEYATFCATQAYEQEHREAAN